MLIGIANGLDLTERVLPMLKGRGLSPQVLHFMPYSKPQLVEIIRARIADVPALPTGKAVLDSVAVTLCAAKVTSFNGDLRNCIDICGRVCELSAKKPEARQLMLMMTLFKEASLDFGP